MSVAAVNVPTTSTATPRSPHHGHRSRGGSAADGSVAKATSAGQAKAQESLQQRADEGDPVAIAELKAEHPQPAAAEPKSPEPSATRQSGAREPGKGEQVDTYA